LDFNFYLSSYVKLRSRIDKHHKIQNNPNRLNSKRNKKINRKWKIKYLYHYNRIFNGYPQSVEFPFLSNGLPNYLLQTVGSNHHYTFNCNTNPPLLNFGKRSNIIKNKNRNKNKNNSFNIIQLRNINGSKGNKNKFLKSLVTPSYSFPLYRNPAIYTINANSNNNNSINHNLNINNNINGGFPINNFGYSNNGNYISQNISPFPLHSHSKRNLNGPRTVILHSNPVFPVNPPFHNTYTCYSAPTPLTNLNLRPVKIYYILYITYYILKFY